MENIQNLLVNSKLLAFLVWLCRTFKHICGAKTLKIPSNFKELCNGRGSCVNFYKIGLNITFLFIFINISVYFKTNVKLVQCHYEIK